MKLKEIIIGVVAVALVAIVAVGATLAYLTATDEETNVMTVGDIELEILEFERVSTDTSGVDAQLQAFTNSTKKLIPSIVPADFDYTKKEATVNWDKDKDGKEIKEDYTSNIWDPAKIRSAEDKMVFVKNKGKYADAYVRLYFAFEAGQYASFEQFQNKIRLNINETDWDWKWDEKLAEVKGMKCFVACATYTKSIAPGELTNISLSQIALDVNATNADSASFGDKYDVLLVAQGIQSEEMGTPEAALNNGFGTDVPFAGFRYVDFTILETALHNLNAVANNTIISKVNSVTFGLFEDYYEEVIGHEGVATTNDSGDGEFAGYTYYVPNGDKYDLYVLTDSGVIYTPEDSEKLFQGMTVLTKVDTANLDVSKTTCMNYMFSKCSALAEIDVSKWDVSNVTTMYYMFERCSSLAGLAVSEWNVQKVWRMEYTFYGCSALTSDKFDVSKWDVSAVSSFGGMFNGCSSLTTLDLSKWQTGSATKMWEMFYGCKSLTTLEISNFNVSGVASVANMFNGCASLAKIDLSYWNTANFNDTKSMFAYCRKLTTIYVGQGWNLSGVTVNDKGKSQHSGMFTEDTNLVGGMGTTLIKNEQEQYITDKTYAIIDGGPSNPGYLTQGPAPANP